MAVQEVLEQGGASSLVQFPQLGAPTNGTMPASCRNGAEGEHSREAVGPRYRGQEWHFQSLRRGAR